MTHSQDGQDEFVIKHLNKMRNGYFLDIGASDGVLYSNTYRLETEYEWTGLLVECDPPTVDMLRKNRKSIIDTRPVWSKTGEEVKFKSVELGKLSGIESNLSHPKALKRSGKTLHLTTVSLDDLLQQHECPLHINYFSLDVEGSEYDILSAYSFKHTFDVITVEHLKNKDEITSLLRDKGYTAAQMIMKDQETIFVRNP